MRDYTGDLYGSILVTSIDRDNPHRVNIKRLCCGKEQVIGRDQLTWFRKDKPMRCEDCLKSPVVIEEIKRDNWERIKEECQMRVDAPSTPSGYWPPLGRLGHRSGY